MPHKRFDGVRLTGGPPINCPVAKRVKATDFDSVIAVSNTAGATIDQVFGTPDQPPILMYELPTKGSS